MVTRRPWGGMRGEEGVKIEGRGGIRAPPWWLTDVFCTFSWGAIKNFGRRAARREGRVREKDI